ncbi:probable glutamate receptor [Bufo gargarizans]|uniref:probable glutamate receptor n=1 Tax=Bufo gargarizans TaxID=30331 RepID=UPI001CF317B0|nr:probable glutamate receptor [Bufo gargarizans]
MKKSLALLLTLVILWMEDAGAERSDGFHLKGRTKRQIPKTVTVTTILEQPFAMMTDSGELEGYCVDLLSELSEALKFNYTLHVVKDSRYGIKDQNGDWNGMVGEVIRKEADLVVAPLTITAVRENVISFTKPFMQTGIGILLKKESSSEGSYLFGFLNPFSKELWIGIIISYVITSLCLYLVGRLSPCEWAEPSNEQNQYTLLNSLWFGMGAFTLQGVEPQPKSVSARIIAVIWWIFSITLLAAYIASFASYVNNTKGQTPNIQTFHDLLKQDKVEFGTMANSSTFNFFKNSKNPTFRMIYEYMDKRKDRVLVKSFSEGVQRVRTSNYAFLGESSSQDFAVAKHCDLVRAPEIIGGRGYGIAASLDSPLIKPLTITILEQFESGNLEYLRQKWWETTCAATQGQDGWVPVQPHTLGGIFLILGIGLALGLIVSFIELVCKSKCKAGQQQKSCCSAFSEELGQRFGRTENQESLEKVQP